MYISEQQVKVSHAVKQWIYLIYQTGKHCLCPYRTSKLERKAFSVGSQQEKVPVKRGAEIYLHC